MRALAAICLLCSAVTAAPTQDAPPPPARVSAVTYRLFYAESAENDGAALAQQLAPLLPPDAEVQLFPLPATCADSEGLRRLVHAIDAGVSLLPSLALSEARGACATLPLRGLTKEMVDQTLRRLAECPQPDAPTRTRREIARLYWLCGTWTLGASATDAEQDAIIARMKSLMMSPEQSEELAQFIGLHCLYPAVMQQYAIGYQGGHSPRTEAKLLEAIAVLEWVRDANPLSRLGRLAHQEREKLRAARIKSRSYE